MPAFQIIDAMVSKIMAIKAVQYLLIFLLLGCTALIVYYKICNGILDLQLAAAKGSLAGVQAQVVMQNEGIKQLQEQGKLAEERVVKARYEALQASKVTKERVRVIMTNPAPTGCDEARLYGIELAKQLTEGKP
jgi:hypothetical protein